MMNYFLTGPLPDKLSSISVRGSDHFTIAAKVNNDPKGWTVYGWYKASTVTDNAVGNTDAGESNIKTASGLTNYHVSHIHPGNRDFLDKTTTKGKALQKLKYDVEKINL